MLEDYVDPRGLGEVFNAPVDLLLTWHDVVDPDAHTLECHRGEDGVYRLVTSGQGDVTVSHPDWPDLAIDLAALWR
jgi:hypothetical protein